MSLDAQDDSFEPWLKRAAHVADAVPGYSSVVRVGGRLLAGRLQIVRQIGEGGMGRVFEAYDAERRCGVALKTLTRLDAAGVYLLKNEFRSLAEVSHPNLVRLHELVAEAGEWFFTMELVTGTRFDAWVRPNALDEARLRDALRQLVEGIAALHAAGKLHRDIKPSNVLVTPAGRVILLDFGMAVDPAPGGVGQTVQDESVSGTPAYMAPEQAAGMPATAASDFYALGVMLFESLRGQLPFSGGIHEVLVDKQRRPAPRLRDTAAPSDLAELCDALLQRDPALRPDACTLAKALGTRAADLTAMSGEAQPKGSSDQLLGREHELAQLRAAFEATCSGQAVSVLVSGESGVGKTALCRAFVDDLRQQGNTVVLMGRCYERERVPFKGIDSLIDDLSRHLRKLRSVEAAALMPRDVFALARIFPVLSRVDAVASAPSRPIADPQELRLRAFSAFAELLARMRDVSPLVLCIDDAQWLDADALKLLDHLLTQHEPVASLLLLSLRSDDPSGPSCVDELVHRNGRTLCRLSLSPLQPSAAEALAARLLGEQPAELVAQVASECNGNPFFIRALSRHIELHGAATRPTFHECLVAHMATLEASSRQLLEVLAVAGRPLPVVLALDAAHADHVHVDELQAERFARRSGNDSGLRLECYHDKIRESVVLALAPEPLRETHSRLFAALLARPNPDVEHLALHAEGAGDRDAAALYAAQAGARANESMAFDQAAAFFARAIELGSHDDETRRALHVSLGEALANAGRCMDAARAYVNAAHGAPVEDALDFKRRAAEQLLIGGHADAGKDLLVEVLGAQGLGLPRDRKAALLAVGVEGLRLRIRGLDLRERAPAVSNAQSRELSVLWSASRGLANVDVFTGSALICRYIRLALDSGIADHAARALSYLSCALSQRRGLTARADIERLLGRAMALAIASGRADAEAQVEFSRGLSAFMQGDLTRSARELTAALQTMRERCTDMALELATAQCYQQLALGYRGELAFGPQLAATIEEAWKRGDVHAAIVLTESSANTRLMCGDLAGLKRDLERADTHVALSRIGTLEWSLMCTHLKYALYSADFERGLALVQTHWAALDQNGILHWPMPHTLYRGLRGRFAVELARAGSPQAAALRKLARKDARALRRQGLPVATARGACLEADLALDMGHPAAAAAAFETALANYDAAGMLLACHTVRRRLGQLRGDHTGDQLIAAAELALQAAGAVDLEATSRLFML